MTVEYHAGSSAAAEEVALAEGVKGSQLRSSRPGDPLLSSLAQILFPLPDAPIQGEQEEWPPLLPALAGGDSWAQCSYQDSAFGLISAGMVAAGRC